MITAPLFHRRIDTGEDEIEIVRGEGGPHVSVYAGPFCWQIKLQDIGPVIFLLASVATTPQLLFPGLLLSDGHMLTAGTGADQTHVWISASVFHVRMPFDVLRQLIGYLSEARADIGRRAAEATQTSIAGGVQP